MVGDVPVLALLATAVAFVLLPAALVAYFLGGRGLVWALAGLAVAGAFAVLDALFGTPSERSTGMEGIVIVVAPVLWISAALCSGLVFLSVRALGYLPRQRRARSEKR